MVLHDLGGRLERGTPHSYFHRVIQEVSLLMPYKTGAFAFKEVNMTAARHSRVLLVLLFILIRPRLSND